MIPLDGFEKWSTLLDEYASQYLNEVEHQEYEAIPDPEKLNQLKAILEKPIARFSPVNEVYFRAKWADVLHAAHAG
jgi:hypothetical protein